MEHKTTWKGRVSLLSAALMVSILITSGSISLVVKGEGSDTEEQTKRSLKIGSMLPIDSLNPLLGVNANSFVLYGLVYDTLFAPDVDLEKDGHLVKEARMLPLDHPEMIAGGYPLGSVWEYDIVANLTWHNGEPVTMDDITWNINVRCENYDVMWSPQPYMFTTQMAEIVDEDTVRVYFFDRETEEPAPSALGDWCWIHLLPRQLLEDMDPAYLNVQWNGVFENSEPPIVGTGPFIATPTILEDWKAGTDMTLIRNPNYHWASERGMEVNFDKVVFRSYDDATAMRLALISGDIDIAEFPTETFKAIESGVESGSIKNIDTYAGRKITHHWTQLAFNMAEGGPNPSRLDPAIRHALAMATNKSYIVSNFYNGYGEPATTSIPPINKWHYEPTSEELFHFDIDAANQLLEDSGYRYPTPGSEYRVCTADSLAVKEGWVDEGTELDYWMIVRREAPEEKLIAKYLQDMWKTAGVKIHYDVVDDAYLAIACYGFQFDTLMWYWAGCIEPSWQLFCQSKYAWGGWTDNRYANPDYDENFSLQSHTLNPDERRTYIDNCQRIHYRDVANMAFIYLNQTYAWRTDTFTGWGDWEEEPGLSIDNFWTANELFFRLEPIGDDKTIFDAESAALVAGVFVAMIAAAVTISRLKKRKGGGKKNRPLGE
jgi:peptide/nickel transport system substrate-binding protein